MTGPLAWVSLVRVLGILGVVLIHVAGLTYGRAAVEGSVAQFAAGVLDFSQMWAVPGFVIASGATLLGESADDAVSFWRKRMRRIMVPLLFWHAAYILFTRLVLGYDPSVRAISSALLQGRTYTALYFFWLILGLYMAAPILRAFVAKLSLRGRWTVALALCAWQAGALSVEATLNSLGAAPVGGRMNVATIFLPYLGYFVSGLALRDTRVGRRWVGPLATVALATGALTVAQRMGLAGGGWVSVLAPPAYYGLGNMLFSLSVVALLKRFADRWIRLEHGWLADAVHRWGRRSLGVFAVHLLVLYVAQVATDNWPDGAGTLLGMWALFAMTVVGSALVTVIFERIPGLRRVV